MIGEKCRCCGMALTGTPILAYSDMPAQAQNFPDEVNLSKDHGVEMQLYQCENCGLIQIPGSPVDYYKDVIRASAVSDEMKEYRLQYFKDFVREYGLEGEKILEVGTGKGEFLTIMSQTGVQAFGIEHKKESVEECKKQGLSVREDFIESPDTRLEDAPFDGFFIMNFLEHIPEPNVFLQGIRNNLSEGAIGLIEVPNTDFILDNLMFSEFITDHLMYFTKETLCLLLEKNGFDVLTCNVVWHDYCLAAIVKKRSPLQLQGFSEKQDRIVAEINRFIDDNHALGHKVAVWGAGHQALAVIALAGIKEKVEFVVDSADFKQNKYTPGTHLKIMSPSVLDSGDIKAILVMAASFSDEVADIIKRRYKDIKIGILREGGIETC